MTASSLSTRGGDGSDAERNRCVIGPDVTSTTSATSSRSRIRSADRRRSRGVALRRWSQGSNVVHRRRHGRGGGQSAVGCDSGTSERDRRRLRPRRGRPRRWHLPARRGPTGSRPKPAASHRDDVPPSAHRPPRRPADPMQRATIAAAECDCSSDLVPMSGTGEAVAAEGDVPGVERVPVERQRADPSNRPSPRPRVRRRFQLEHASGQRTATRRTVNRRRDASIWANAVSRNRR